MDALVANPVQYGKFWSTLCVSDLLRIYILRFDFEPCSIFRFLFLIYFLPFACSVDSSICTLTLAGSYRCSFGKDMGLSLEVWEGHFGTDDGNDCAMCISVVAMHQRVVLWILEEEVIGYITHSTATIYGGGKGEYWMWQHDDGLNIPVALASLH